MSVLLGGAPDPRTGVRPVARFVAFALVVVLGTGALTVRLFSLQIAGGGKYGDLSRANSTVAQAIPSTRGIIYDASGTPLVTNIATYAVKIRPADLPEEARASVVHSLASILGTSETDINVAIDASTGSRYDLVTIASNVDPQIANLISEASPDLPGVEVVVEARRHYTDGALFSQVLGYMGPITPEALPGLTAKGYLPDDYTGVAGVESIYEAQLRGTYGSETVERDATGRRLQVLSVDQQPVAGDSLRLNIDEADQKAAEQAVSWVMQVSGIKRGVLIAMDPQTGQIKALVSLPTYDDNLFALGISSADYQKLLTDPNKPLTNHAASEQFAPGSTFKLITGSAVLADKKITTATRLQTAPYLQIGTQKFWDWNHRGFGLCNITCGYENSSDTFFYQAAALVGIERLAFWARHFGLGAPTGIDLPSEASGIVPDEQWKMDTFGEPIYPGDVYLSGIGQGYDAVTPLQLLNAYAALANGGTLYSPRVVGDVLAPDGTVVQPYAPTVLGTLGVSASILKTMRLGARKVVFDGHTQIPSTFPIVIAAKTGTAEFGARNAAGLLRFHSWFAGFVPKNPYVTASDPGGAKAAARTDAQLAFVAFAFDSNTKGNAAVEMVKYFLQLHFNLTKDYRRPDLLVLRAGYTPD